MSNKIENCQTVTCRMPRKLADHLKRIAISMSKQQGRVISMSEFIRETMIAYYPITEQADLFSEKKPKRLRRT